MATHLQEIADHLAAWRSHKNVRAGRIVGDFNDYEFHLKVIGVDGKEHQYPIMEGMHARYKHKDGDYLVIYDDGYCSISPRKVFEDGYSQV
jgi:hypothetical protein